MKGRAMLSKNTPSIKVPPVSENQQKVRSDDAKNVADNLAQTAHEKNVHPQKFSQTQAQKMPIDNDPDDPMSS